ncbi:MAG: hypothetical protein J4F43_01470 [Dehalococcoidia bacterium]|nr:hypothetical protein [Dehalococcoidia bacterium]
MQAPQALEDLRITSSTTGQELVARISEAEASCIGSAMGARYDLFQGAPLMVAAGNPDAKALFAGCLQDDNLVVLGVALMSAQLGGWAEDSLGCVADISRDHPEMVYVALGVEGKQPDAAHPAQVHSIILDMYECLETREKAGFSVAMISSSLEVAPFSGQDLIDALTETDVECLKANLPGPMFSMIAGLPSVAGGELRDAPPQVTECMSPESLNRITGGILANGLGAASDDSRACMIEFAGSHSHYIELARTAAADPGGLTDEEYLELVEDGLKVFSCMTEEELAQFQNTHLPFLVP